MTALARGWEAGRDGAEPVIWSPASAAWGAVLNQRLAEASRPAMVGEGTPFMLTPLVIAMPKRMAEALGWPAKALGWSDILNLARSAEGWAAYGHPEWGPFRLGKTNPNFSTSGLSALIAQAYAAAGKASGLSQEDLARPEVTAFASGVESSVVHYGDTTLTFLNNWARADRRGAALLYVSAAAVEEKSVVDYNAGNPDGVLDPGEEPRPPREPLVALYPREGTLYSDNPFFVLDAPWVDDDERQAARVFGDFVQRPENQQRVLAFGFRPGNPQVAVAAPIEAANGVDPDQPRTLLAVPEPRVVSRLLEQWDTQRKGARVQLIVDVSGSMGEPAVAGRNDTRLDLAKAAGTQALALFSPNDEVGLRVFTSDIDGRGGDSLDLVPIGPIAQTREAMRAAIDGLVPLRGTPLYNVARRGYEELQGAYRPDRINAVVLLTDGVNDDGDPANDRQQLDELLSRLRQGSEGENSRPVRLFTIAYGEDADIEVLRQMAEATSAAAYDAADPQSIDAVLTAVISNF